MSKEKERDAPDGQVILDYIRRFEARYGAEPSYTQICKHFRVKSKATIARRLAALEKCGLLPKRHSSPLRSATQI